jgi:hypothetical protein
MPIERGRALARLRKPVIFEFLANGADAIEAQALAERVVDVVFRGLPVVGKP